MIISEKFASENIFTLMKNTNLIDFLTNKTDDELEQINALFKLKYGNYILMTDYENMGIDAIAKLISVSLYDIWNKNYAVWSKLEFPLKRKREIAETRKNTNENTANRNNENLNKVSGYDSTELVEKEQTNVTETNTANNTENGETNRTETEYNPNLFNNLEDYKKYLNKNFLCSTIYRDIIKILCVFVF